MDNKYSGCYCYCFAIAIAIAVAVAVAVAIVVVVVVVSGRRLFDVWLFGLLIKEML